MHACTLRAGSIFPEGPFIIVSNHVSNWDPVALGIAFSDRQVRALGKQELFELPVLGRIAYWTGGIPIRRGEADREALSRCKAALRAGRSAQGRAVRIAPACRGPGPGGR